MVGKTPYVQSASLKKIFLLQKTYHNTHRKNCEFLPQIDKVNSFEFWEQHVSKIAISNNDSCPNTAFPSSTLPEH